MAAPGGARCPSCGQLFPSAGYCANDGTKLVPVAPEANDALVGKTLDGRYQIQSLLAPPRSGAIGTMYRGYQVTVSREVAIKVVHPHYAHDVNAVERFLHAGRRAAQLVAPAIANVFDVGRSSDGILYVVSELARGRSLTDYTGHALPVRRAVGLAIQLADALAAVHRERLVHGDLELASLVVDESSVGDQLKLLDVGLAAALGQRCFAPECLDGAAPEARSDLYAAGAIYHELLTGAPPFAASSPEALAGKHRRERPPQLPPHVPVPLATIVARLLGKTPGERYAAATDLRAALVEVQAMVGAPTTSNPGIALPRAPSNPNLALPRTASADYGMQPRTASGNYPPHTATPPAGTPSYPRPQSEPAMPRTTSADYGMHPRTASGNYPPTPPAGTSYPPHTATPPSGVAYPQPGYGNDPAIARTASGNYPPAMPRTVTPPQGPTIPRTMTPNAPSDYPVISRAASRDFVPQADGKSRRWIVIVLVALIASGGGIVAILLAG